MSANHVINAFKNELNLKNDISICRATSILPPHLSKLRSGVIKPGAAFILRIHEAAPEAFPVRRIRELLALRSPT